MPGLGAVDWAPTDKNDPIYGGVVTTPLPIKLLVSLASPSRHLDKNPKGRLVKSGRKPDKLGSSCKANKYSDTGTGDLGVLPTHETSPWLNSTRVNVAASTSVQMGPQKGRNSLDTFLNATDSHLLIESIYFRKDKKTFSGRYYSRLTTTVVFRKKQVMIYSIINQPVQPINGASNQRDRAFHPKVGGNRRSYTRSLIPIKQN